MKWWRKKVLCCVFVLLVSLSGCGEKTGTKVVFTTGMGNDEVFRIGSSTCTLPEIMVYLTDTSNQYERVYSPEVWKISRDGITLEENVKEAVLARLAQVKVMYLLAQERGLSLDDGEEKLAGQAAEAYFDSLTDQDREEMGVDVSTIEQLYREYALADKVYQSIIQDVNPEISDDEARTIKVQHILIRTGTVDEKGRITAYTEEQKQEAYQKALEIRRMAVDDGEDFLELASRYSEDSVITCSFGKGERDAVFEEAAFSLETDEVSQVIETREGYHIIKCISTFDREQTDLNKLAIVEERRREVFGQEYDAFVEALPRQLNTQLWKSMELPHGEEPGETSFFEIYNSCFLQ